MKILAAAVALLIPVSAFAATNSTPGNEKVPQLSSFGEAEAYLAARGVQVKAKTQGVHATREGKALYDEYQYDADGQELSVLLFKDAADAASYTSVLAESEKDSRTILRGRVIFLSKDSALSAEITGPAAPAKLEGFADVESLLAARGLSVASRSASASNDLAVVHEYVLQGGTKVAVYRFDDPSKAQEFSAARSGAKSILNGRFVFVVPQASNDAELVYDLLAAE